MNPSKSLMALFVSALLFAAAAARAGMTVLYSGGHPFYADTEKLNALKVGQKLELFRGLNSTRTGGIDKASSNVERVPDPTDARKTILQINLWNEKSHRFVPTKAQDVKAVQEEAARKRAATTPQVVGKKTENKGPEKPKTVKDQAVWDLVVKNALVPDDKREATAQALEKFATDHPDEYKKLIDAGGPMLDAAVAGVAHRLMDAPAGPIDDFLMAQSENVGGPEAAPVQAAPVDDGKNDRLFDDAIDRLAKLLVENKELRGRMMTRYQEFVFAADKTPETSYVDLSQLDSDAKKETELVRLKGLVPCLVEVLLNVKDGDPKCDGAREAAAKSPDAKKYQDPNNAKALAYLYFVLGDNTDLPGGLTGKYPVLKTLKDIDVRKDADGTSILTELTNRMTIFTRTPRANSGEPNPTGPYIGKPDGSGQGNGLDDWWLGFTVKAQGYAKEIYDGKGIGKKEVKASVDKLDEGGNPPGAGDKDKTGGVVGGGDDAKRILSEGFGMEDIYGHECAPSDDCKNNPALRKGGIVGWIPADPDHPEKGSRRISIKLYTAREGGQKVDKIGVFDITNPGDPKTPPDIYGRRIGLNDYATTKLQLDPGRGDALEYKVTLGKDGTFKFQDSEGQNGLQTSVAELYGLREAQVKTGPMVQINSQNFYVSYQGAPKGMFTYYPADKDGKLKASSDDGRMKPSNIVQASEPGPDGFSKTKTGYEALGNIGPEGKEVFYYIKWDKKLGNFVYKSCDEAKKDDPKLTCKEPEDDVPPPPAAAADPKKTTDKTTTTNKSADDNPKTEDEGGPKEATKTANLTKDCSGESRNTYSKNFEASMVDGWTVFLNKESESNAADPDKKLNLYVLCYDGTKGLTGVGVLLPADGLQSIRESGTSMVFESVSSLNKVFITPTQIKNGSVNLTKSQYEYKDGTLASGVGNRTISFVRKDDMAKAKEGAQVGKLAWAVYGLDMASGEAKSVEVHVPEVDSAQAADLVGEALNMGKASVSPANKADKPRIMKELEKDIEARKSKLSKPLQVTVWLYAADTASAKTIDDALTVGDVVVLRYCHLPKSPEEKSVPRGLYLDSDKTFCVPQ